MAFIKNLHKVIEFKLGVVKVYIMGGSYYHKPKDYIGVKMAAEIPLACDINIPTKDFSVPNKTLMHMGVRATIPLLAEGKRVYVGCMGGLGRTGLFLACLAKALGYKDPIQYVRSNYNHHAVETREQERFVRDFDTSEYKNLVLKSKFRAIWFKLFK